MPSNPDLVEFFECWIQDCDVDPGDEFTHDAKSDWDDWCAEVWRDSAEDSYREARGNLDDVLKLADHRKRLRLYK